MNKPQLFCFTYAGGTSSFFKGIANDLPEINLVALEYSGHGSRHGEQLYKSFDELAEDMFCMIKSSYEYGGYSLFGYSMGTISLIEVLKRVMKQREIPLPDYVFLAAHEPKTKAELSGFSSGELDDLVKERTIRFGGVPERLINSKIFWRTYLPLYRADYSIIGKYNFDELSMVSQIPAVVFYSESDTKKNDIEQWRNIFTGECDFFQYEGNHFFINKHHEEMAEIIRNRMIKRESV